VLLIVVRVLVAALILGATGTLVSADCRWDWDCSRTPCRLLPFGLGLLALAHPAAVGVGVVPGDADHGLCPGV
jgi:hypothetical protein